jgi:hypothetical protein
MPGFWSRRARPARGRGGRGAPPQGPESQSSTSSGQSVDFRQVEGVEVGSLGRASVDAGPLQWSLDQVSGQRVYSLLFVDSDTDVGPLTGIGT